MTAEIAKNPIPTYRVISRHSAQCAKKSKGITYVECTCPKSIRVYDPRIADPKRRQTHFLDQDGRERRSPFSVHTRSAADAEKIAQSYRDRHDPDKQRAAAAEAKLKALQAEKESKTVTIEEAVARFLVFKRDNPDRRSSRRSGKASERTMSRYKILLGDVDPTTFEIKRRGRLFAWLDTLNPRPILISELTKARVDAFRATWSEPMPGSKKSKALNDLTTATSFTTLKTFFNYCKERGEWIETHPMDGLKRPSVEEGYRTAPFTDAQYDSIIAAIKSRYPEFETVRGKKQFKNFEDQKKWEDTYRLLALVELMRWGGLALVDAIKFKLSSMKDNGEVTYRRQKTGRKAEPTLPAHVVALIREVVPIDSDADQPFYDRNIKDESNCGRWRLIQKEIFEAAGIGSVRTDIRERDPHGHMFRDTFVVNQIRAQKKLGIVDLDSIAMAIGDSEATLRKHYAPWVQELEDAHRETQRMIVEAQIKAQERSQHARKVLKIGRP